ncbi:MAG: lysophospholipid acyltransferase family protein [Candidatus Binatia bacterium]
MVILVTVAQYVATVLSWLLLKVFTRLEIEGRKNLIELAPPFVVATNHESHLDPQLIGVAMLQRPDLFPLRYMAKNQLFHIPGLGIIIWLLGAFRAHKKQGIGKSLLTPTKILEKGGNVIMFPEGHIVAERPKLGEGRRGAAILALTTRAAILPMSLHTPHGLSPLKFVFTRPRIVIRIGEPFYLNNLEYPDFSDENTYAATKVIMQKIADLYYHHEY